MARLNKMTNGEYEITKRQIRESTVFWTQQYYISFKINTEKNIDNLKCGRGCFRITKYYVGFSPILKHAVY